MTPGMARFREPADAIVSRFTVAWVEDQAIARKKRRLVWVMVACGIAGAGSIFAVLFFDAPLVVAAGAVAVVPFIAAAIRWRAYHRLDVDDRKLQTVLRVLKILRADIPRTARVALMVDLRNYDAAATGQKSVTAVASGVAAFTDAWFRLSAPLADGNLVTLSLTDRIKRKTKRKGRIRLGARSTIRIGIHLAKQYRPAAAVATRLQGRSAGDGLRVSGAAAASESRVVVVFRSPRVQRLRDLPAGDATLRALASVYRGLASVRQQA